MEIGDRFLENPEYLLHDVKFDEIVHRDGNH